MKMRYLGLFLVLTFLLTGCTISLFNRPVPREEYLNQLIHAHESNPHAQFLRAKRFLDQGKGAQAEQSLKQALKAAPDRVEFYVGLGIAYEEQGRMRAARKAYEEALVLNPLSAQAEIRLGRLAWRTGHIEDAREWAAKAARHDDSADLWRLKGEIAYISVDYPGALAAWRKSLEKMPDQPILQEMVADLQGFMAEKPQNKAQ